METSVVGIEVNGLEFDVFEYLIEYLIDECPVVIPNELIEIGSFVLINDYLISNGINSELIFEVVDDVLGITIDGFEFDDIELAIEEIEEEYGYEVEYWEMLLGHKSFDTLHDFLLEEGIYSELIF